MEFVAIDVETANADMASICQIGLAKVHTPSRFGCLSCAICMLSRPR